MFMEALAMRRPVIATCIAGVSEFTTGAAAQFARDAESLGAAGLMVLPAMVYVPKPEELDSAFWHGLAVPCDERIKNCNRVPGLNQCFGSG